MSRLLLTPVITLALVLSWAMPAQAADEEVAKDEPSYVSLGKPLVLNLRSDSRRLTFLQVAADVLVRNEEAKEIVTTHIPAIRHQLILMLSEQPASAMKSPVQREEVRKKLTVAVREMIDDLSNNNDVEEVLFSNFLVQ